MALLVEQQFVQDTYEIIADRFNITRAYLWKGVKEFLNKVPAYSTIVEILITTAIIIPMYAVLTRLMKNFLN